mmetsp:Transcript_38144/g.89449  ORF Transcript_38144/g.89449 Transcript_38144/m.89449 type:complete len:230 (-) Transcript_38144:2034-2723(-)
MMWGRCRRCCRCSHHLQSGMRLQGVHSQSLLRHLHPISCAGWGTRTQSTRTRWWRLTVARPTGSSYWLWAWACNAGDHEVTYGDQSSTLRLNQQLTFHQGTPNKFMPNQILVGTRSSNGRQRFPQLPRSFQELGHSIVDGISCAPWLSQHLAYVSHALREKLQLELHALGVHLILVICIALARTCSAPLQFLLYPSLQLGVLFVVIPLLLLGSLVSQLRSSYCHALFHQ